MMDVANKRGERSMKKYVMNSGVLVVGLALVLAGCGGSDEDNTDQSSNLDPETKDILDIALMTTANFGDFANAATPFAKNKLQGVAQTYNKAFFNEPIPGFTSGSAVRNGNMHVTYSISVGEYSGSVTISGNYLTMITFNRAVTPGGAQVNGRMSDGGTIAGNVYANTSGGSGRMELVDTIQSQPDFTVNGKTHSILLKTTYVITANSNGAVTKSATQTGIIDSRPVSRTL